MVEIVRSGLVLGLCGLRDSLWGIITIYHVDGELKAKGEKTVKPSSNLIAHPSKLQQRREQKMNRTTESPKKDL